MSRATIDLEGLPPQHAVVSEAENATRAYHAVRKVVKEQGQVMSSALENNESLWNTNKVLRERNKLLEETCQRLDKERSHYIGLLQAIPEEMQERLVLLGENNMLKSENEALLHANSELRLELIRSVTPELDSDQRKERIERLKQQAKELAATGLVPTEAELAERDEKLWGKPETVAEREDRVSHPRGLDS